MARPKGQPKLGGRKKGTPNKTTKAAKEAFVLAFAGMGGVAAFTKWAKANETEFYRLYSKLIPMDVTSDGKPITTTQTIVIGGQKVEF